MANVNDQLLELYKQFFPTSNSDDQIVKHIIEKELLCSEICGEEQIKSAKELASNLFFDDIGSWVEYWIRSRLFDKLSICRNCKIKSDEDYCPIQNVFVNPNFKACGSFKL